MSDRFKNLACQKGIDDEVHAELTAAGVQAHIMPVVLDGEVRTRVMGSLDPYKWQFERAWNYWVATGPGIPVDYATALHNVHGKVCRVGGDCTCPSPLKAYRGFGVGLYHVDSPDGLKALADTIKVVGANAAKQKEQP